MKVTVGRPLAADEEVQFELDCFGTPVAGQARVLRQQGFTTYALRFERLTAPAQVALAELTGTG